jgi:hypothetical protein
MTDTPHAAQPTRITEHETWELELVEHALAQEFPGVRRREVETAVNAALARLEPVRRRQLVPQLVRDAARRQLHGRDDALTRPVARPMATDTGAHRSGAR